jgi:hypothetical protein
MEKPFKRPDIVGAAVACLEQAKRGSRQHERRWPRTTIREFGVIPSTDPEEGKAHEHGALA